VVLQHPGIKGRGLDAGCRVELPADILDFGRDLPRIPSARSLECHMLEKMRQAMFVLALVTRAGLDPDSQSNGLNVRKGFGGDRQAVRQTAYLNTHKGL